MCLGRDLGNGLLGEVELPGQHCLCVLTITGRCLPLGNLLSSLMGSSEQEEGEESQDDGSPIELD